MGALPAFQPGAVQLGGTLVLPGSAGSSNAPAPLVCYVDPRQVVLIN